MFGIFAIMAAVILVEAVFIVYFVNKAAAIIDAYKSDLALAQYVEEDAHPGEMSKTAKSVMKVWEENGDE